MFIRKNITEMVLISQYDAAFITAAAGLLGIVIGSLLSSYQRFSTERKNNESFCNIIQAEVKEANDLIAEIYKIYVQWNPNESESTRNGIITRINTSLAMNEFNPIFLSNLTFFSSLDSMFIKKCFDFFNKYKFNIRLFTYTNDRLPLPLVYNEDVDIDQVLNKLTDFSQQAEEISNAENLYRTSYIELPVLITNTIERVQSRIKGLRLPSSMKEDIIVTTLKRN